ncbi:MAG: hypothetical protein KDI75_06190 [Xanthomonadales bacterium]|nr:hypothetical protein [Xanthomonadales bacterium]
MKKALTGCLVVVLLAIVVGGGAAYWFIVRPAWDAGSAFIDQAKQWQQVAELDKQVRNTETFAVPEDGRLDQAKVNRFLTVQRDIIAALGNDWQTLDQRYKQMNEERKASGRDANLQEVLQTYNDVAGLVLTAKKAQVEALNRNDMSLGEYRWTRQQAFAALPLLAGQQIPDQLKGTSMAANAELLRGHKDELAKGMATSVLSF